MPTLTPEQVREYAASGCVFPIPLLSAAETAHSHQQLLNFFASGGWPLNPSTRHKPHLYLQWVSDLVRHPTIIGAVQDLLGPNLLVWRSTFFVKPPHDHSYVAWHQDSAYWHLSADEVTTGWIALTDSTPENGCVRIVAGSHCGPAVPHTVGLAPHNVLIRGQSAAVDVPEDRVVNVALRAGQASLHHVRLLHGSGCNRSAAMRAGIAVRYIAPHVRPLGRRHSATLVSGIDNEGHFDHEPLPQHDYDPVALAWHARSVRQYTVELLRETLRHPTLQSVRSACRVAANPGILRFIVRQLIGATPRAIRPGNARR